MAVAARSLATVAEDVTLAQYRVLVELAARGPQRWPTSPTALRVDRSTATRMCDRLVRKRLVHRRRVSRIAAGCGCRLHRPRRELVAEVSRRRRAEIATIVRRMPAATGSRWCARCRRLPTRRVRCPSRTGRWGGIWIGELEQGRREADRAEAIDGTVNRRPSPRPVAGPGPRVAVYERGWAGNRLGLVVMALVVGAGAGLARHCFAG